MNDSQYFDYELTLRVWTDPFFHFFIKRGAFLRAPVASRHDGRYTLMWLWFVVSFVPKNLTHGIHIFGFHIFKGGPPIFGLSLIFEVSEWTWYRRAATNGVVWRQYGCFVVGF